ncbi:ATP-binding protein [Occallatibacter riparius]|uniref:ATP-binding protein n=1 Tax=Occallatibacter riparius TaxID=1002689 RepID=A0A9J7BR64_9BACT|nr:ATP-binding protein [Occallatibacter riparius]UWZ83422.1 ATP-binding protein [Occallatibacter riparius]
MGESLTIEVKNTHGAIAPAAAKAEAWLEAYDPSPKAMYLVPLAIEELVTNCIHYGYEDKGEHTIVITLSVADQTLTMTLEDDGHEFDPLAQGTPDLTGPAEDRPIGGLGIHLLRSLADGMAYERRNGTNRLTLTKRLH